MMLPFTSHRITLILTLTALPLLVGSSCAFFFSSGDGSSGRKITAKDNDNDNDNDQIIVANSGIFGDPAVTGVSYESGSLAGITGEKGEFQFETDKTIRFFVGDISLGQPVAAKSMMTPKDLVLKEASGTSAEVNLLRLLQSLDSVPGDEVITIPEEVRAAAVKSNDTVSSAIEFLDFSDDHAFVNAASQLVAVLTTTYPFTAMLVDADNSQQQPLKSIKHLKAGK
jgi:hypothetical protein